MPRASATRLYEEDGDVRCGVPRGKRKCGRVVLRDGKVIDREGHEHSLSELFVAGKRAGQVTTDEFLRQIVELENALRCDLAPYRQIEGLVVVGPAEIERAFLGPEGENSLNLSAGWCEAIAPLPEHTPEVMARVAQYCQTDNWQCAPVLVLELDRVATRPTSLLQMREWFGYPHDGSGPGTLRQDVHYSNWYCSEQYRKQKWAIAPVALQPRWAVRYLPHPHRTTPKFYSDQLKALKNFPGISAAEATGEVWMMDILTALGQRCYRETMWSRTETQVDGWPLVVYLNGNGVHVDLSYDPERAYDYIGLAVEGVLGLVA